MHYRVDLEDLLAFVDQLQMFESKAETIAVRVDGQVRDLHGTWSGSAADAHRGGHDEWMVGASRMREAAAALKAAARAAHQNYTDAVATNIAMLTS